MARPFQELEVTGLKELRKAIKEAALDPKLLSQANKDAANVIVPEAQRRSPVRSGKLKRTTKGSGTLKAAVVKAGTPKSVPYALPIHWGWPARGIKAQPFVALAAKATEATWFGVYQKAVQDILDDIAYAAIEA